jgi:hypothetical protein
MENEEVISETDSNSQSQKLKTSRLAITSMVFAILGPFLFGPMLILLFYGLSFYDLITQSPYRMTLFSCILAWILGLILGIKSLGQIDNSQGLLVGRAYAIAGIAISLAWILSILGGLFFPALYYVNS